MEELKKKTVLYSVPEWAGGALYYQLVPDRFARSKNYSVSETEGRNYKKNWEDEVSWKPDENKQFSNNDFYRGNLRGIAEKISYFKLLKVNVIYIQPINFSLTRYDHYAATDLMEIDPDLGYFEDLKELHEKCNNADIHLVLDIAFNHCNIDNSIYKDAISNPNSIHKDWFKRDENGNIVFWYNFNDMPEFNLSSKGYQDYVFGEDGVIALFSKYVDGFRLDLAENLTPEFIEGIKERANAETPHLIIGEYWQNPDPNIVGRCIDAPTSYPLTNAILKGVAYGEFSYLRDLVKEMVNEYPIENLNAFLVSLDTHDIPRVLTMFGRLDMMCKGVKDIWKIDEYPSPWHKNGTFDTEGFRKDELKNEKLSDEQYKNAKDMLKIAVVIQYFLIGSPCIYYGTEKGMQGFKDPFNRRPMKWGNDFDRELFDFYVTLGKARDLFNFRNASAPKIIACDSEMFCFARENTEGHKVLVIVNRGNNERIVKSILDRWGNQPSSWTLDYNCDRLRNSVRPNGFLIMIS